MDEFRETAVTRKTIGFRFLYTLFYLIVFEIVKILLQITVLFQYVSLFIWKRYSDPVRDFSNKLTSYAYQLMRYLTLTDNIRPFPFSTFPTEKDDAAEVVDFR